MRLFRALLVAALFGTAPLVAIQSASAAPLVADHGLGKIGTKAERIQYRHHGFRHHGDWRQGGHGYNGRYGRYGGGYYRNGPAVIGGLAVGAIIGGAIANSHARVDTDGYALNDISPMIPRREHISDTMDGVTPVRKTSSAQVREPRNSARLPSDLDSHLATIQVRWPPLQT